MCSPIFQGLGGRQVGLEGLARPGVADGEDGGDPAGVDESGGDAGLGGQGHGGDVAPGHGDPPGGGQQAALRAGLALAVVQELGHAVGPGAGVLGAVEGAPGGEVGQTVTPILARPCISPLIHAKIPKLISNHMKGE